MKLKDLLRTVIDNELELNLELMLPNGKPVTGLKLEGKTLTLGWNPIEESKVLEVVTALKISPGTARSLLFQANWNVPYALTLGDKCKGSI